MNEQDKLIEEQKKKLPTELLRAIEATPWKNFVQDIGKANGLNIDQLVFLEQETMFIIYGFVNPTEYSSNLVREVGIDEDKAIDISDDVWKKIMEPISQRIGARENQIPQTTETKEQAMERLSQRMRGESPRAIEVVPPSLPMIEEGEVAHSVPHVELPQTTPVIQTSSEPNPQTPLSATKYVDDKDPYREPLV